MPRNPLTQTASFYRWGAESTGWGVYNYATNTYTSVSSATTIENLTTETKLGLAPVTIATTHLEDTEWIETPLRLREGEQINVWAAGAATVNNVAPTGLDVYLRNEDTSTDRQIASGQKRNTTSDDTPLDSLQGPKDVSIKLANNTGAAVDAGCHVQLTIEDSV